MINGTLVRLRALRPEDLEQHLAWRNDPEVVHWATGGDPFFGPVTREALEIAFAAKLRLVPHQAGVLTVESTATGQPIGLVDYRDIDPLVTRATLGITIGDRPHWGRGHGTEALGLLVGHLFTTMGLHRLELDTWAGNERAQRTFRRLGFREEGRRRSDALVAGEWQDRVLFGLLRSEWAGEAAKVAVAAESAG
ncbi:GNAT family N-acetyltransferase [Kitasatospora sp. MMS16-BH015]|uniref:GNAT family N-acetyltransferase n=1 Tax=Kitasatospora sp. MMS16-BH015 TaxID=2018025 RepID=UPI000CF1DDAC|nr:GNAT family protein [Kitasatospora sp. MMS16-BH015]